MTGEASTPIPPVRRSPRKHGSSSHHDSSATVEPEAKRPKVSDSAPEQNVLPPPSSEITESPYNNPPFREAERMSYMHSFLLKHTVKQLREISKPFKLRVSNRSQAQLVARIVLYFHVKSFDDMSIRDCVSTNQKLSGYELYERNARERHETLSRLPDVSEFFENVHRTDRQPILKSILRYQNEDDSGFPLTQEQEWGGDPSFSLNEFARLVILLRDDEQTKKALESAYSKTLTRSDLDARVSRDSFWKVIANRFNDATVDSKHDFSGRLDEVESNERPLCKRAPEVLKRQYENVRKLVTVVRSKWSKSGQNDPSNFVNFLRRTSNKDELTAESKRVYVFIIVTKLGQPDEAEDLLAMTSKLIEEDGGGLEEGFLGDEENNQAFPSQTGKEGSKRNSGSAKEIGEMSKAVDRVSRFSEEQTAMLREHLIMERERHAGPQKSNEERLRDDIEPRIRVVTMLNESSKQLKIARDLGDVSLVRALGSSIDSLSYSSSEDTSHNTRVSIRLNSLAMFRRCVTSCTS